MRDGNEIGEKAIRRILIHNSSLPDHFTTLQPMCGRNHGGVAAVVPNSPTIAIDGARSTLKSAQFILELGEYVLSVTELSTLDPR